MTFDRRVLYCATFMVLLLIFNPLTAFAEDRFTSLDERKVTLIYYGSDEGSMKNVHFLDGTLSGLFEHVELVNLDDVNAEKLRNSEIIVFYSAYEIDDQKKLNLFSDYEEFVLGIGDGALHLPQFSDWTISGKQSVFSIGEKKLERPMEILKIKPAEQMEVIEWGQKFEERFPVILKNSAKGFVDFNTFDSERRFIFSKSLFSLFQLEEPEIHPAYIRLEDISPVSDPKQVSETAAYLLDKGIPVYLVIIPVYINPETGKKVTLDDAPDLKKVLEQLVSRGAYVISHGYTHTYHSTETGEGFEFWDSVMNQPITALAADESVAKIKSRDEFSSLEEYGKYLRSLQQIESQYTKNKLENSIHSLTNWGLPPTAFEAPHYAMSSNGYRVASQYFSAIFGQMQVSDTDWKVMTAPLFISSPAILNGMTLYPETIGYVNPDSLDPIGEVEEVLDEVAEVPGAVIGGIYHPYLGMEYLEEFVSLFEKVPNLQWIELDQYPHSVQTDYVQISMPGDGRILVKEEFPWQTKITNYFKDNPVEALLWVIVAVTGIFLSIFIVYIFFLRIRYRKQLFEERN